MRNLWTATRNTLEDLLWRWRHRGVDWVSAHDDDEAREVAGAIARLWKTPAWGQRMPDGTWRVCWRRGSL